MGWLMCRVGIHKWKHVHTAESGGRDAGYETCERCGKDHNQYGPPSRNDRYGPVK